MSSVISLLRRLRRSESGAELVEFALTLPLLLLVVLGMIEFGFVFQQYEVVTNAAREGARIAALPTYASNAAAAQANVTARVNEYLTAGGLNPALATICGGGMGCPGDWASVKVQLAAGPPAVCVFTFPVKVSYPHPTPFIGGIITYFGGSYGTLTLSATSKMRTEAAAGSC